MTELEKRSAKAPSDGDGIDDIHAGEAQFADTSGANPLRDGWPMGTELAGKSAYPPRSKELFERARNKLISKDINKIRALYGEQSWDLHGEFAYEQGSLLAQLGKEPEAVAAFEACLNAQPGFLPAVWSQERILRKKKIPAELISLMEGQSMDGEEPAVLSIHNYFSGIEHEKIGLPDIAMDYYREALKTPHEHFLPLFAALTTALNLGHIGEAAHYCASLAGHFEESSISSDFLLFAGHLLSRSGAENEALEYLQEAIAISHDNAHEVWFEMERLSKKSGDIKTQAEILREHCKYHLSRNELTDAVPVALELSILMEGKLHNPSAAMSILRVIKDIKNFPFLAVRLADLAWRMEDYPWLEQFWGDKNSYYSYFAHAKLEKPLPPMHEELSLPEKLEYHCIDHLSSHRGEPLLHAAQLWDNPGARAPLYLAAATANNLLGEPSSHIMDRYLSNGFVTTEGLWQALWVYLMEEEYQGLEQIEELAHHLGEEDRAALLGELANHAVLHGHNFEEARGSMRRALAISRSPGDLIFTALLTLHAKAIGAAPLILEASQGVADPSEATTLALWAAKLFMLQGDRENCEFILKEQIHDTRALRAWELFHRAWSDAAPLQSMVQELADRGDPRASYELALLKSATDPQKAQELAEQVNRPEARWLATTLAHGLDNFQNYTLLMDVAAKDYPEDKFLILAKTGLDAETEFGESPADYYQRAYESSPLDPLVYYLWRRATPLAQSDSFIDARPPALEWWEEFDNQFITTWHYERGVTSRNLWRDDASKPLVVALSRLHYARIKDWDNWVQTVPGSFPHLRYEAASIAQIVCEQRASNPPLNDPDLFTLLYPLRTPSAHIDKLFPDLQGTGTPERLHSLGLEQDGNINAAAAKRIIVDQANDFLPVALTWLRLARVSNQPQIVIRQLAMAADALPRFSEKRISILWELGEEAMEQGFSELAIQAWHNHWIESEEKGAGIRLAIQTAVASNNPIVASILWQNYSRHAAPDYMGEMLAAHSAFLTYTPLPEQGSEEWPFILDPLAPLTPVEYNAPQFGTTPTTGSTFDFMVADAALLETLGYKENNHHWIMEAARLQFATGDIPKGYNLLYAVEPEEGTPLALEKTLLTFSAACKMRISSDANEQATALALRGISPAAALAAEFSVILDEPPRGDLLSRWPELFNQSNVDRIAGQRDEAALIDALTSLGAADHAMHIILARLMEERDPKLSMEIYGNYTGTLFAPYVRFRRFLLADRENNTKTLWEDLHGLYKVAPLPWLELEMVKRNKLPQDHGDHPLVLWAAAQKGLVPYRLIADKVVSRRLAARFTMNHLAITDDPIDAEVVSLDDESYEWEALWKMRCSRYAPQGRQEMLHSWAEAVPDPVMNWWLDLPPMESGTPTGLISLVLVDAFSLTKNLDSHLRSWLEVVSPVVKGAIERLLVLAGDHRP
ncbi:hypothetical protein KKF84_22685, partial [Myxococcota bacterium]|nr:hypothetical protein [Myxococcota bacterium]